MPDPRPRQSDGRGTPPLALSLGVVLLHVWRWGYTYGSSDHDELLPPVLHRLDPALFAGDPFVLEQTAGISVRTAFQVLVEAPAHLLPLPLVVGVLHGLVLLAMAVGTYRLAYALVPDRLGASVGTVLAVVVWPHVTLGGNAYTYAALVPEGIAWAVALPAVRWFLQGRRVRAGALLGVAAWFHLLVGFQTALVLGVVALWGAAVHRSRAEAWGAVRFGLAAAAVAAPLAVPAVLSNPLLAGDGLAGRSTFDVLARLRLPHHYLFFSFPVGSLVRFGLLALGGGAAYLTLARRGVLRHGAVLRRGAVVGSGLCLGAVVLTEGVPVLVVAQLQWFKLTVWAAALLSIGVGAWAARILPDRLRSALDGVLVRPRLALAVVAGGALLSAAVLVASPALRDRLDRPGAHRASDLGRVEAWMRDHTPVDALVLVPPTNSTFRMTARRSVVTNYKTMGLDVERLLRVAPAPLPDRGDGAWRAALDRAYASHGAETWAPLARSVGATHALLDLSATRTPPPGPPLVRQGRWAVYEVAEPPRRPAP